jgi:hypothetical protein
MSTKDEFGGNFGLFIMATAWVMCFLTTYTVLTVQSSWWLFLILTVVFFLFFFYFISIVKMIRHMSRVCAE